MRPLRIVASVSLLALAIAVVAHAAFLKVNWASIADPQSSPCFSSGAPFGDCAPQLALVGLAVPLWALAAVAFLFTPAGALASRVSRADHLVSGFAISTITFDVGILVSEAVPYLFQIGLPLVVAPLAVASAAATGATALLRQRGPLRLQGAAGFASALGLIYLFPFVVFLTFD